MREVAIVTFKKCYCNLISSEKGLLSCASVICKTFERKYRS